MRRIAPALGGALVLVVTMSIGRFAYTPILPFMRDVDGLSTSAAGWVASANYLGYLLGAATARMLSGRLGLRPTMRLGLVLSAATTLGMAVTSAAGPWAVLRLVGGAASAWAMIAVAAMVLGAAGDDRRRTANVMFAGVGVGIVVSTLVIAVCAAGDDDPGRMWLVLGLAGVVAAVGADRLVAGVPAAPIATPRRVARVPLPPDVRRLVASYACAGFGYVITATYIVLIVRESDLGRWLEVLTWCVVGAWSAISTWLVARIGAVTGDRRALVIAHGLQAAGVLSVAFVPGTAGVLVGATLLGATFAGITGVGVDLAGRMHPADPTRAIAVMTTAFAVGQMIGPALGGWLADRTGTFRVPSVLAAVVLLAGGAILLARSAQREPEDVRVTA
jgi:MFS family permease